MTDHRTIQNKDDQSILLEEEKGKKGIMWKKRNQHRTKAGWINKSTMMW